MRTSLLAVLTATLVALTGCSRTVDGTARPDPRKPGTVLTEDGYGIVAGFDDAPVRWRSSPNRSASTAPICRRDFGDDIAAPHQSRPADGHLPADDLPRRRRPTGTRPGSAMPCSWRRSADVGDGVPGLRRRRSTRSTRLRATDEIADVARQAGYRAAWRRAHRGRRVRAVDAADMSNTNFGYLFELTPLDARHPNGLRPRRATSCSTSTTTTGCPCSWRPLDGRGVSAHAPMRSARPRRPASPPPRSSRRG